MLTLAITILVAPLIGFGIQFFFGKRLPRQGDLLTVGTIGVSLACATSIMLQMWSGAAPINEAIEWLRPAGPDGPVWTFGIFIDGLTATMLFVVTLVAFLVHVFSMGYMKGDPKYHLFFAWLQMFSVSMLLLVLSNNLLHLFMGWELVGLCSYKLIGFWSEKPAPGNAARKAFITTRIGDLGMLVAIMVIYKFVGSFDFDVIFAAVANGAIDDAWLTMAGLGIFLAAVGKSAQMPLHVWLPDAMEGPTPVSALIHAATMVAAGVYLVGRMMPMLTPDVLVVVASIGALTGLVAGFIALAQDDIKKVLAYSTVSQLGYMFLGLGVGAWHAALFHLTTHAFFKALMFLGSGSVIHACHHEQDMRKMGGLLKKIPVTGFTFLIGVLAIAGVPFLSGFYSKDAILSGAYHRFPVLFWMGLAAAVLTAFYMTRLFVMTFLGKPRDQHIHDHAHEGPFSMKMPLVVLAVLSVAAGFGWHKVLLDPAQVQADTAQELTAWGVHAQSQDPDAELATLQTVGDMAHFEHSSTVMVLAIFAGAIGLFLGFLVFRTMASKVGALKKPFSGLERAFANKFWFDELYREAILKPGYAVARFFRVVDERGVDGLVNGAGRLGKNILGRFSGLFDHHAVDGAVRGTGGLMSGLGAVVSGLQNGRVRSYLTVSAGALALTLLILLL